MILIFHVLQALFRKNEATVHIALVIIIQDLDGMTTVVLEVPNESQLRRLSSRLEEAGVQHKLWVEQPEDYPTCLATRYTTLVLFFCFFLGALFPRTADPIFHESLCLHPPTAGLCPKTLHLDLVIPPEGDSIQVLPAVSFWKRKRYRLSYRGKGYVDGMRGKKYSS